MSERVAAVILAAGLGKRMKSGLAKYLHPVCGVPMVVHVVEAAREAGAEEIVVVIGHQRERVRQLLGESVAYAVQEEQLGTGHAVAQTLPWLREQAGRRRGVLVLCGDTPLLSGALLGEFASFHLSCSPSPGATVLAARLPDPNGYGRIILGADGEFRAIVEESEANTDEKAVNLVNAGTYVFDPAALAEALGRLARDNRQGEFYLTDVPGLFRQDGKAVAVFAAPDAEQVLGVNTRGDLARSEGILRRRILGRHMENGVTIIDPEQTYIHAGVEIGPDTILYPGSILEGRTIVEPSCEIGPYTRLRDCRVQAGSKVEFSVAEGSLIMENSVVGPYARLRAGCRIGPQAKVGNFAEIKNSSVGRGSKVPHHSYIGDAEIGEGVNIGAGAVFVNYDGRAKHPTFVEDGAFVGCNANLIAPVRVSSGSYVAAGSTINRDVPPGALGIARSRQENKAGWAERRKAGPVGDRKTT